MRYTHRSWPQPQQALRHASLEQHCWGNIPDELPGLHNMTLEPSQTVIFSYRLLCDFIVRGESICFCTLCQYKKIMEVLIIKLLHVCNWVQTVTVDTYTAGPKEVPTVFQHGIHIDRLALVDVNEATVLWVIILQSSSDENGICEYTTTRFRWVLQQFNHHYLKFFFCCIISYRKKKKSYPCCLATNKASIYF